MSPERRYNEQEIAAIFKQAAADQETAKGQLPHSGGLTLAEMEQIGKEAGITPEFIARAAASIDRAPPLPPTTSLGLPVSVAQTVDLPGSFSDKDWDRLVLDLHDTFQVTGEISFNGSLRQWSHGSLQVVVEPTDSGHRLRIRTENYTDRGLLMGSLIFFIMGLFFLMLLAAKGGLTADWAKIIFVSMFSIAGAGGMGIAAYRLPRWRKQQAFLISQIITRAAERAESQQTATLQEPAKSGRLEIDLPEEPQKHEQTRKTSTRT